DGSGRPAAAAASPSSSRCGRARAVRADPRSPAAWCRDCPAGAPAARWDGWEHPAVPLDAARRQGDALLVRAAAVALWVVEVLPVVEALRDGSRRARAALAPAAAPERATAGLLHAPQAPVHSQRPEPRAVPAAPPGGARAESPRASAAARR